VGEIRQQDMALRCQLQTLRQLQGVVAVVVHPHSIILVMKNRWWMNNSGHIPFYVGKRVVVLCNRERLPQSERDLISRPQQLCM